MSAANPVKCSQHEAIQWPAGPASKWLPHQTNVLGSQQLAAAATVLSNTGA